MKKAPYKQRIIVMAILIAAASAGLNAWNIYHPSGVWRYKMTVEVQTPEGLKTGSAVREVAVHNGIKLTTEMLPDISVKGEAVVVDLGERGVLFALLRGAVHGVDYGSDILFDAFSSEKRRVGKVILNSNQYPMFVTFAEMDNPNTVKNATNITRITPSAVNYNLKSEIFGKGVSLKDITIEITDAPVTWKIENRLPWLSRIKGGYLDGQFAGGGPNLSNILYGGDFKRGGS